MPTTICPGSGKNRSHRYLGEHGRVYGEPGILDFIPEGKSYGFDNLMLDLIAARQPASCGNSSGYWLDIGRPDDYMQAIEEFDK